MRRGSEFENLSFSPFRVEMHIVSAYSEAWGQCSEFGVRVWRGLVRMWEVRSGAVLRALVVVIIVPSQGLTDKLSVENETM